MEFHINIILRINGNIDNSNFYFIKVYKYIDNIHDVYYNKIVTMS
jgi:hypothetical protein